MLRIVRFCIDWSKERCRALSGVDRGPRSRREDLNSMLLLSLLTVQSFKALLDAALAEHFLEIASHSNQDPTSSETGSTIDERESRIQGINSLNHMLALLDPFIVVRTTLFCISSNLILLSIRQ